MNSSMVLDAQLPRVLENGFLKQILKISLGDMLSWFFIGRRKSTFF
jgi:hypothetical protein